MGFTRILPLLFLISSNAMSQELPFYSIPPAAEHYTAANSITRMIEGLGFRYYWATEGLREEDLNYQPTSESQSTLGTLRHIHGLSRTIAEAIQGKPSIRPAVKAPGDLQTLRRETLEFLKKAAIELADKTEQELKELHIVFDRSGMQSQFPIWNLINGPITDAIYHTGQVVSFRRTSGNPIYKGVNVFLGVKN